MIPVKEIDSKQERKLQYFANIIVIVYAIYLLQCYNLLNILRCISLVGQPEHIITK